MNRWLALGLLVATGLALGLRCPQLDVRPMHNDEAVNGVKFGALWERGKYKYDPTEYHGPTLYYASAALGYLTGAPDFAHFSENRLRFLTVLFGLGLVLLLPLLSDGLGRQATGWAACLTAVSPAMVFYSRYYIHEMLLVFFALLALAAGWRYWRTRKIGWALLSGAGIGLMNATKETFIITLASAGLALGLNQIWNRMLDASGLPVKAPRLNLWHLAAGLGVWLVVAAVLLSSFFSNPTGPMDSIRTYLPWLNRAGGASPHIHPWSFYLQRLLFFHIAKGPFWSEGFIVVLAIIAAIAGFARKGLGEANASLTRFLAFYTVILTVAYSLIAYKTPWCLLNFWQGAILLAGIGAAVLVNAGRQAWSRVAARVVLCVGCVQLGAQAWQASVSYASDQRNPYVYAQTSPDILRLVHRVESLARVHPAGRQMPIKVMAPESEYWPLPWYLRNFSQVGWWDKVPSEPFAPVMIVASKFEAALDEKKTHLMPGYFQLRPQVFFELYVELQVWQDWLARKNSDDEAMESSDDKGK
jgi:uncharacterized protein (TIGR03663 family)